MSDMIGKMFVVEAMDLKRMELVKKVVTLTDILDGPGADRRDYCTIEGMQAWDIDMPLEDFEKMVICEAE